MSFGLSGRNIKMIHKYIQDVFGADTDLKVYVFGSRATGKNRRNSDLDLALKSKDQEINKKISKLKLQIEDSEFPYKVDIVNWDEILKEYFSAINKQKKLFWTKKNAVVMSPWRPCPIGFHWVNEHLKKGNLDNTDPHCRRNRSKKDVLKPDEIKKISELEIFLNPPVKATSEDLGFKNGKKFDNLINGWVAFWNDVFKPELPLHPNHIKALIATESGFVTNPKAPPGHTAIGLTQIMPKTVSLLSPRSKELKDHFIDVSKTEMLDPNVNICSSVRWLFRKRELILRKKKSADWLDTLEEYKGITSQSSKTPARIKSDIRKFYEKL